MAVMSYIDAITLAMREEMERDEKVFVLGEDVGKKVACLKRHTVCMINLVKIVRLMHRLQNLQLPGSNWCGNVWYASNR